MSAYAVGLSEIKQAVMMVGWQSEHCPWSRAELEHEVSVMTYTPIDVSEAVDGLYGSPSCTCHANWSSSTARRSGRTSCGCSRVRWYLAVRAAQVLFA